MIDLNDVAVLVEAVAAGSLAGAARRLGIGPMVASRRLSALEEELGVRLVHRTTRALALTPEGEAFWPYAQTLLENATDGRAAVRPAASGAAGRLRVTSSVPFARKVVAPMMAGFLCDNPALEVERDLGVQARLPEAEGDRHLPPVKPSAHHGMAAQWEEPSWVPC